MSRSLAHAIMPGEHAYNHACCLARAGQREAAFARLQDAVDRGFVGPADLAHAADLATLRDDPRWPPGPRAAP